MCIRDRSRTSQHAAGGTTVATRRPPPNHVSRHTAVAELGQAALRGLNVSEVFELALDLTGEALDVEFIKILHQDAPGEPLVLVAGRGWTDNVCIGETTVSCDRRSQAGYTLMSAEPILVEDLEHEERFTAPSLLVDQGIRSGISVIIPDRERPYGVLGVHTRHRHRFTADDANFLRSIANVIGGCLLYTSDAADDLTRVDLGGRRIIKKKKT